MGLLSGLSNLGLGNLENAEIYEKEIDADVAGNDKAKETPVVFNEEDMLFDKKCNCPVCDEEFTYRAIRTGKLKMVSQDPDLRPKYDKMDPSKYDVIVCDRCRYAALSRFWQPLPTAVVKLLKENYCGKVHGVTRGSTISYDDAIIRYQLALGAAIVKHAKDSEKAYICLKLAWVIRSKKETLPDDTPNYDAVISQLRADENEALKNAFEGFIAARAKEDFPMCGMDELTVDYLLAVLAERFGHLDIAQKLVSSILVSKSANNRIKEKARELKEHIKIDIQMAKENS